MAGTKPPETPLGTIGGVVHGGHQPDIGAAVYVYQAGTTGYKSAATSLLTSYTTGNWPTTPDGNGNYYVTTNAQGSFNITGEYTCTSGAQVYIYVLGGNTGGGSPNPNAGFLAVLGQCPASGTLSGTIGNVYINEVSTVAAAYALAAYAADATHIGGPAMSDTLGQTGIANAFLTAGNLFNVQSGYGSVVVAPPTTPNGNGTVPQTKMNALANSLAACVNTTGSSTISPNACNTLLADARSGGTTGTTPTDTATAAINIAHNPTANVAAIFNLGAATGTPYVPALAKTPNDWTMSIIYTGGGLTTSVDSAGDLDLAQHELTIDAAGNVWEAGGLGGNVLSGFSNLGVPLSSTGYTDPSLNSPVCATLDATSSNIWMANSAGVTASSPGVTLSVFNIANSAWTVVTPVSGTTDELNDPNDVVFDGAGNIWVANANSNNLVKLTSAGAYTAAGTDATYVQDALGLAAEPGTAGNIWVVGYNSKATKEYATLWSNADVLTAEPKIDYNQNSGVAIDASGNAWAADLEFYVSKINATGTTVNNYYFESGGYYIPEFVSVAVDGAGNIWLPDFANGVITEVNSSGATLQGNYGLYPAGDPAYTKGKAPPTGYVQPYDGVIDGSGNLWFSVLGVAELEEMVGVAAPVVTPLSYATANSLLGQEP